LTGNQTITVSGDESGSGATSISLTANPTQNNIRTLGGPITVSSLTVVGANGITDTYGLSIGSETGAGLTSCSAAGNALTWSNSTNLFGCASGYLTGNQSITWTGSGDVTGTASGATSLTPTLTAAATQSHITTFTSSITVTTNLLVSSNSLISGTTHYGGGILAVNSIQWPNGTIQTSSPTAGGGSTNPAGSSTQVQVNNSGSFGVQTYFTAASTGVAIASNLFTGSQSSTHTTVGNTVFYGGLALSSSTSNGTAGVINAAYTTGCNDSVIFSSAPDPAGNIITLGPSRTCPGQVIQIIKVDGSIAASTIVVTAGDLISGTTGTLYLNSQSQSDELISDGAGNWWPHGQGIQATLPYIGIPWMSASGVTTSSTVYVMSTYIPVPTTVTGFIVRQPIGGLGPTNVYSLGLYDGYGNLLLSTGPINHAAANINIPMTPTNLSPGSYWLSIVSNGSTNTFGLIGNSSTVFNCLSRQLSGTIALDSPIVWSNYAYAGKCFSVSMSVNGVPIQQ
jgi:hypothetical protein